MSDFHDNFGKFIGFLFIYAAVLAVVVFLVQLCWNDALVPALAVARPISAGQSFGIVALVMLLSTAILRVNRGK
jgi:hypothetical protein